MKDECLSIHEAQACTTAQRPSTVSHFAFEAKATATAGTTSRHDCIVGKIRVHYTERAGTTMLTYPCPASSFMLLLGRHSFRTHPTLPNTPFGERRSEWIGSFAA